MTDPSVFVPVLLGLSFLVAGLVTYRRDLVSAGARGAMGLVPLGPVFVAASLATFSGEHFTGATSLAALVPKWLPAPVFVAYFVGAALFAAALSLVARRCVRWSSISLAVMFSLFVLLLYLPSAIRHPAARLAWVFPLREGTFAMGALALFAIETRQRRPQASRNLATVARFWAAIALIFYGSMHLRFPQYSPGVPDNKLTAPWVPLPLPVAYATGVLLVVLGALALLRKYAAKALASAGWLMFLLTLLLYLADLFLARGAEQQVDALNFVADTLLFAGALLLITQANLNDSPATIASARSAG